MAFKFHEIIFLCLLFVRTLFRKKANFFSFFIRAVFGSDPLKNPVLGEGLAGLDRF